MITFEIQTGVKNGVSSPEDQWWTLIILHRTQIFIEIIYLLK